MKKKHHNKRIDHPRRWDGFFAAYMSRVIDTYTQESSIKNGTGKGKMWRRKAGNISSLN